MSCLPGNVTPSPFLGFGFVSCPLQKILTNGLGRIYEPYSEENRTGQVKLIYFFWYSSKPNLLIGPCFPSG